MICFVDEVAPPRAPNSTQHTVQYATVRYSTGTYQMTSRTVRTITSMYCMVLVRSILYVRILTAHRWWWWWTTTLHFIYWESLNRSPFPLRCPPPPQRTAGKTWWNGIMVTMLNTTSRINSIAAQRNYLWFHFHTLSIPTPICVWYNNKDFYCLRFSSPQIFSHISLLIGGARNNYAPRTCSTYTYCTT